MNPARQIRRGQAGVIRGCCLGIVLLGVLLIAGGGYLTQRALAAPDLGAPPGGTAHGSNQTLLAASLAADLAVQVISKPHAVVTLSEKDLTVIADEHNPEPAKYRNPQARIRGQYVVVSAQTSVGPFDATAVARYTLLFDDSTGRPNITAQAVDYAVGRLTIPDWARSQLDPRGSGTLSLNALLGSNPALHLVADHLECVAIAPDGIRLGFHRPDVAMDPAACRLSAS